MLITESRLMSLVDQLHDAVEIGEWRPLMHASIELEVYLLDLIDKKPHFISNGTKRRAERLSVSGDDIEGQLNFDDLTRGKFQSRSLQQRLQ